MDKTLNIAHRGARSIAPENTIVAAKKAFEFGADMWELDTGLLADGQLIIMHDDTLERTTNVAEVFPEKTKFLLHEFTLDEIRQLEAGSHFVKNDPFGQIESGAVSKDELDEFSQEPVPTLEQALIFTKEYSWKVNVEIKSIASTKNDMTIVEKTVAMIKSLQMEKNVLISSFNHDYLRKVKQLAPDLETGWLTPVGMRFQRSRVLQAKCTAYHPSPVGLTHNIIRHFQQKNIAVNAWTINDKDDMEKLMNWGINGIITDYPQTLQELR